MAHKATVSDSGGTAIVTETVKAEAAWDELYKNRKDFGFNQGASPRSKNLFTSNVEEFKSALARLKPEGDEACFVGLDFALDMPWRADPECHRVVVFFSDEPLETGLLIDESKSKADDLVKKIQELGVLLIMFAPESDGYEMLSEADKSQYTTNESTDDGLEKVDFSDVMEQLAKSISTQTKETKRSANKPDPLFDQFDWGTVAAEMKGR